MFEGIITPIVTPFYNDEMQSINMEATSDLIEHVISKGVKGIFILGSNGEFHVIDEAEKLAFAKAVVQIVNHRVPVFAGTGCCSTKETITLSQKMEAIGVDALSVISPYFMKGSNAELYQHFKAVAKSVHIPILLYNIPKATGANIATEVVEKLAAIENIKGIKDSSGDLEILQAYCDISKQQDIKVLVGSDSKISEGYAMGASGAVAGTSNVITEILVNLDTALCEQDVPTAKKLQKDIDVLRGVLPLNTMPSVMKRACELAGIANVGNARRPVLPCTKEDDAKIKEMLQHYNLLK